MKPIPHALLCMAAAGALLFQAGVAAADATSPVTTTAAAGQKLDSGLGDLPHYRDWADPTGKAPVATKVAGQKIDSGLGDLPHYRYWADPTGKAPVRTEQVVAESTIRR
jgi:outer membrane receptor protein involved in Fe transport